MAVQSHTSNRRSDNEWEIDWNTRRYINPGGPQVWGRNPASYQARARDWHWTSYATLQKVGMPWQRKREITGRHRTQQGYVILSRGFMSAEQVAAAEINDLWIGTTRGTKRGVREHMLVAAIKYGRLPKGIVVRHRNGQKDDNRPENLVLGSRRDNALDHRRAVVEMFYWRERALLAEGRDPIKALE